MCVSVSVILNREAILNRLSTLIPNIPMCTGLSLSRPQSVVFIGIDRWERLRRPLWSHNALMRVSGDSLVTTNACMRTNVTEIDPVQTPISLDKGLYKHVHLFCLTFSANVGHYMAVIEAYRGLDRVRVARPRRSSDLIPTVGA